MHKAIQQPKMTQIERHERRWTGGEDVIRLAALVALPLLFSSCSGGSPSGPSTALAITAVSPSVGSSLGGTPVTISGANFAAGLSVTIGGVAATGVSIAGSSSAAAVTGARDAGAVDVVVTSGGQTATLRNGFTYVAPPPGAVAPSIQSLVATGSRPNHPANFADLGESLTVSATVPALSVPLTYAWTATTGTISGSGPSVTWRAPQSLAVPGRAVISLTVTARYSAPGPGGVMVQHDLPAAASLTVRVHDSAREVGEMARKFLLLFSDSSVPPEVVVQDFLPNCGADGKGREYELSDVIFNRRTFEITAFQVGQPQVTVAFRGRCPFRNRAADACAHIHVVWTSREKSTGRSGTVTGIDHVTAIHNGTRWGLCDSDFEPLSDTGLGLRGRFKP
jgi:hypothetical protein